MTKTIEKAVSCALEARRRSAGNRPRRHVAAGSPLPVLPKLFLKLLTVVLLPAVLLSLLLFLPSVAVAQEEGANGSNLRHSIALKLGSYSPQISLTQVESLGGERTRVELDNGKSVELAYEVHGEPPTFSGEIGLGRLHAEHSLEGQTVSDKVLFTTESTFLQATGKFRAPSQDGHLQFFAGLGLHVQSVHFELKHPPPSNEVTSEGKTLPGAHAVLGTEVTPHPNVALGLELRWFRSNRPRIEFARIDTFDGRVVALAVRWIM